MCSCPGRSRKIVILKEGMFEGLSDKFVCIGYKGLAIRDETYMTRLDRTFQDDADCLINGPNLFASWLVESSRKRRGSSGKFSCC